METLIFDCDGVLVDSEVIAEMTLAERLAEWLPDLDIETEIGKALGQTTAAILAGLESASQHPLPQDALTLIDDEIEARLAHDLIAIDGVADAIARLTLSKAVVSNSRRLRVESSLNRTGLAEVFGALPIFCAEQVARPKPAPDIYLLAAKTLGVEPADCLVVEDSVSGATAARAAGMTVIGFVGASHIAPGHDQRLDDLGVWRVMRHMSELPGLVQAWQQRRGSHADQQEPDRQAPGQQADNHGSSVSR